MEGQGTVAVQQIVMKIVVHEISHYLAVFRRVIKKKHILVVQYEVLLNDCKKVIESQSRYILLYTL